MVFRTTFPLKWRLYRPFMWQIKVSAGIFDRHPIVQSFFILGRIKGKPCFHVIADDRWLQNVLRSYGNKALRSCALNCLREIIWKPKICHRIVAYNTTNLILWFKPRLFVCRNFSLRTTWRGLNTMLLTRTSWSKLRGMNTFISAKASILKTGRKQPIVETNRRESVVNSVGKFGKLRTGFGRYLNSDDWNEKISSPATRVSL